jgi:hypothetical protein
MYEEEILESWGGMKCIGAREEVSGVELDGSGSGRESGKSD